MNDSLPPPGLRRMVPGQLEQSDIWSNYNQLQEEQVNLDTSDTLPPPGLRRMIPGQIEQNETVRNNNFGNESSSGLSRMVLGYTERMSNAQSAINSAADNLRYILENKFNQDTTVYNVNNRHDEFLIDLIIVQNCKIY